MRIYTHLIFNCLHIQVRIKLTFAKEQLLNSIHHLKLVTIVTKEHIDVKCVSVSLGGLLDMG